MSQKEETKLRKKIKDAIELSYPGSLVIHVHGSPFQEVGIPDLICCIFGHFIGLEVKVNGEATVSQERMSRLIVKAGGYWATVHSEEEALSALKQAILKMA